MSPFRSIDFVVNDYSDQVIRRLVRQLDLRLPLDQDLDLDRDHIRLFMIIDLIQVPVLEYLLVLIRFMILQDYPPGLSLL